MILPAQIALMKGTEGTLGMLEKADTDKPDFVMDTAEVSENIAIGLFDFQKYNTNEMMDINSILMLPYTVVQFSKLFTLV